MKKRKSAVVEADILHGPLLKNIVVYALPITLTSILQQLFNSADTAVVGKFVSDTAQAAVGANGPVINLLVNTFVGMSVGADVVAAKLIATNQQKKVQDTIHTSMWLALSLSVFIIVFGEICASWILKAMSTPADVMDQAVLYLRLYFIGVPFEMVFNFGSAILRSRGDSKRPLYSLLISGILNVFFNLFFVLVCHMGVEGVAIATVISNALASGLIIYFLMAQLPPFQPNPKHLSHDSQIVRDILKVGAPAGLQGAVFSISNICVQSAINSFGSAAVAGASIGLYYDFYTYFFTNGYGQACLTFISQNSAVGQKDRCRKIFWICLGMGLTVTFTVGAVFLLGKDFFLGLYSNEPAVLHYAALKLAGSCFFEFLEAFMDMPAAGLRAQGKSLAPALITILGTCVLRLAWVFFIFPSHHDFSFLMRAYPISWSFTGIIMMTAYGIVVHQDRQRAK